MLPELPEAEKERRTREALADVDAGRTIPHEELLQWGKAAEGAFYCVELTAFFCVGSEIIRISLHWFPTKQNCLRRRTESLRRRSQNVCDEQLGRLRCGDGPTWAHP